MRTNALRRTRLAAALLFVLFAAETVFAQDSMALARQLYGEAAYEEALAMLDRMRAATAEGEAPAVEQYRALCLLALGREADAEKAIEAVIVSNASFQPDPTTTSPRVQAAFREVRRKLLPGIAQQQYLAARAAYDRKEYWSAVERFDTALSLIGTPDAAQGAQEAALADLRTLIVGFRDLARAAVPVNTRPSTPQTKVQDVLPPPPPPPPRAFYTVEDRDVVPPAPISQRLPRWSGLPLSMLSESRRRGIVEVLISEQGLVEAVAIRQPTGSYYDDTLVEQARHWKYSPATREGRPVKYKKLIQFVIQ